MIDLQRWWPALEGTLAYLMGGCSIPPHFGSVLFALVSEAVEQQQGCGRSRTHAAAVCCPFGSSCAETWQSLTPAAGGRDPAEVVTSLVGRDGPLVGMEPFGPAALVAPQPRGGRCCPGGEVAWAVVDFDRWFQAPERQLDVLEQVLPELRPHTGSRP